MNFKQGGRQSKDGHQPDKPLGGVQFANLPGLSFVSVERRGGDNTKV